MDQDPAVLGSMRVARTSKDPGTPPRARAFLDALSRKDRAHLLRAAMLRFYLPDVTLYRQGEPVPALLILLTGCVKECHTSRNGQETILALHGPGDLPGVTDLLEGDPALATCWTLEPTRALTVPAAVVHALLEANSTLTAVLLRSVSGAWHQARAEQVEHVTADAVSQTCQRILELAYRWGRTGDGGVEITVGLTQAELGAWAGLSREAVVKALRDLRERKIVRTGRRTLTVTDLEALDRLAHDEHA